MGARDELEIPPRLVLYDGVCGLCDRAVRWLLAADRRGALCFTPLQGETAGALRRRRLGVPEQLDSIVYLRRERDGLAVYLRSEAAFRIAGDLGPPWRALAWLRVLPRALTDLGYRLLARSRYRIFGRFDACREPPPDARTHFLP